MTILSVVNRYCSCRWVVLGLAGLTCACAGPRGPRVVSNPDPSIKIPAIKQSVADKNMSAVGQLVSDLESDDPAVRFYAIEGLHRLTGETFDYKYFAAESDRAPSLVKWKAWLEGWKAAQGESAAK